MTLLQIHPLFMIIYERSLTLMMNRSYENGMNESDGRESRSYSRGSTWKRRDDSWDKKWSSQVKTTLYTVCQGLWTL